MAEIEIFVFGSNLAGRHGTGAALAAWKQHGANYGQGVGRQGYAYAIPTKDTRLVSLSLPAIAGYVRSFLDYARQHSDLIFRVTPIGCGLAGHRPADIAPMFRGAPANVILPPEFKIMATTDGLPRNVLMHVGNELRKAFEPVVQAEPPARLIELLARLARVTIVPPSSAPAAVQ